MTIYQDLQYKEKKQIDLLHSNQNGKPTSERYGKRRNIQDIRPETRQET